MRKQDPKIKEAAQAMIELFRTDDRGILIRSDAIELFETEFPQFVELNENGNRRIKREVYKELGDLKKALGIKMRYYAGGDYWKCQ
jgi:hypothetical protein